MVKLRHPDGMIGIGLALFLLLCALAPLLASRSDFDDRSRRGWWVNR
jgi:hypothetical protein